MYPLSAQDAALRIRRRIEDQGTRLYTDSEICDLMDEVLASSIFTTARKVSEDREVTVLEIPIADLVTVDSRTYRYTLPEKVADIRYIEGVVSTVGGIVQTIPAAELEFRYEVQGPTYVMDGDRPGDVLLLGNTILNYSQINIWYTRQYAPLHWGTSQGATSTTLQFGTDANTTGRVINRAGLYEGLDIVITNDSPSGVRDQLRRVTSYAGGSARTATVAAWTTTPDATTTYSMVVPITHSELTDYFIELCADKAFSEMGDIVPMPRLDRLRAHFESAVVTRHKPRRVWNKEL